MPLIHNIDAHVLVDGKRTEEYKKRIGGRIVDLDGERSAVRLIESEVGKRFTVRVRLLQGFKLHWANFVAAEISIDDSPFFSRLSESHRAVGHRGGELQDNYLLFDKDGDTTWDPSAGKWMKYGYEFGTLETNDDTCVAAADVDEANASKIGSIRITVFRAKLQPTDESTTYEGGVPEVIGELPERMLKEEDIKTRTNYIPLHEVDIRNRNDDSKRVLVPVPVDGIHGEKYHFTFLYRTRDALESLGCIKPPPPAPKTELQRAVEKSVAEAMKANTEAQVAMLAREFVKLGFMPNATMPVPAVKIKHERHSTRSRGGSRQLTPDSDDDDDRPVEVDATDADGVSKPKPDPEVIDLTQDSDSN